MLLLFSLALCALCGAAEDWGATFRGLPSIARMKENEQLYTAYPHRVGTKEDLQTAMFTLSRFNVSGTAFLDHHTALVTKPITSSVLMSSPVTFRARIKESVFKSDPSSGDDRIVWPSVGYSRPGNVTAPLVYVNYGSVEDYLALPDVSIVRGAIVIVRYGNLHRGIKVRLAEEHGAVGVILYSDPQQDGYVRGPVFPDGPWRPPFSVQRGSCQFISICPGDPSTPECGGTVADHTPSVPVQPLGYGDAYHLLNNLGGPPAPKGFQGGLNFTYTLGGDNVVTLEVDVNWTHIDIYNVCVDFPGRLSNETHVLLGNHHDAWTFGASDPNSGSSVFLEVVRNLHQMQELGWMPDYRIRVCSWDGEESGLIGSTKYALENAEDISANLIAYLNTDVGIAGVTVDGSASPCLASHVQAAMASVTDPVENKPLDQVYDARPFPRGSLKPLGSGSDFTTFWAAFGVPALDWGFRSDFTKAPYHSAFDDFTWMNRFGSLNGTYDYYLVLARLIGTLALDLSRQESTFNVTQTAQSLDDYTDLFKVLVSNSSLANVDVAILEEVVDKFSSVVNTMSISPKKSHLLDRQMLFAAGLPGRPIYKNLISAPGLNNGYAPMVFPGAWQAVLDGNATEANVQIGNLANVLTAGIQFLLN